MSVSLRRLAKRTRDATQSRRLLALAEVYDGGSRTDASRIGGVGLQIIRDWVLRFNARGPDGLVDGKSPGAPSKLNADHRRALAEVVEAGPVPAVDGVVRWRRKDLARWLLETFAISLDETTVGRELKALGFAKISARPRHYAQNELAVEAFKKIGYSLRSPIRSRSVLKTNKKTPMYGLISTHSYHTGNKGKFHNHASEVDTLFKKNFPAELAKIRARLPKGVEIELWWQDEARIGQKNKPHADGPDVARAHGRPATSAPNGPISSARSVPRRGKAPGWSCPGATPTPWRRTSSRSVPPSIPAPMRC